MKYPDNRMSLDTRLPSSVQCWLGHELERRGIDAVVYTRYIISLLLQDHHVDPLESLTFDLGSLWFTPADLPSPYSRKARHRKSERKKYASAEDRNKIAAVECLRSISDEDCGIESLVDELCDRLRQVTTNTQLSDATHSVASQSPKQKEGRHLDRSLEGDGDPVNRYYAEFPALHSYEAEPNFSPTLKESADIWNKNPITCMAQMSQATVVPKVDTGMAAKRPYFAKDVGSRAKNGWSESIRKGRQIDTGSLKFVSKAKKADIGKLAICQSNEKIRQLKEKNEDGTSSPRGNSQSKLLRESNSGMTLSKDCYGNPTATSVIKEIHPSHALGHFSQVQEVFSEEKGIGDTAQVSKEQVDVLPALWWQNALTCYVEQASWYTEPVQEFTLSTSYQDRLYQRQSFSDSQGSPEMSPIVDPDHDDGFIFGMPQIVDDNATADCDDVFLQSDVAIGVSLQDSKSPDNFDDTDTSEGISLMAEKMVADVFIEAGLSRDSTAADEDHLAINYESIIESVKNLESENNARIGHTNVLTNLNIQDGDGASSDTNQSLNLLAPYTSALYPHTYGDGDFLTSIDVHGKVPDISLDSVENLPFWGPDGAASIWNEDFSGGQTGGEMLNHTDKYDRDMIGRTAEDCEVLQGIRYLWDSGPVYKSFDLIASEHTAFDDVIHPKIHHVHSEPNMRLHPGDRHNLTTPITSDTQCRTTESEHLYFSPKTHFCPIYAAEETGVSETKTNVSYTHQMQDLFGGYTPTGSPYQEYRDAPDKTAFVPKFRVQKNSGKFVQTGQSLDEDSPAKRSHDFENCFTDDNQDDKIDFVIAILEDDMPGPDTDTRWSLPATSVEITTTGCAALQDVRSLWVSADDQNAISDCGHDALNAGSIWSSGYDDDTMFLFGNYDDVSGNDAGYFSEHIELSEKDPTTPEPYTEAISEEALMAEASSQQAFSWSLFAPLPSDAVYSSDLEQIWLQKDSQDSTYQKPRLSNASRRKPCTYFMEGKCRRSVCKYSHDLASIACRFWLEGDCFKGRHCPFLHGSRSAQEAGNADDRGVDSKTSPDLASHAPRDLSRSEESNSLTQTFGRQRKQMPRKFYMFKRNSATATMTNKSTSRSPRTSASQKTRDSG